MQFEINFEELQSLKLIAIDEIKALDMEGTVGATEGAASVFSTLPFPPYFYFTCSAS